MPRSGSAPRALPRGRLALHQLIHTPLLSLALLPSLFVLSFKGLTGFPTPPRLGDVNLRLGFPPHLQTDPATCSSILSRGAGGVGGGSPSQEPDPGGSGAGWGAGLLHSSGTTTSVLRTGSGSLFTSGKVQNCLSG